MYSLEKFTKDIPVEEYIKGYVDVPKFVEYCKVCPNYNHKWSCPPYDFAPVDYWKKFNTLKLVCYKMTFENEDNAEKLDVMYKVKSTMLEELLKMEDEIPNSITLSAGSCNNCGENNCAKLSDKPCRFPKSMRFSIEALGGDVVKTAKDLFGIDIRWAEGEDTLPYLILMGGLLSAKND